jgi:hypothetical protein
MSSEIPSPTSHRPATGSACARVPRTGSVRGHAADHSPRQAVGPGQQIAALHIAPNEHTDRRSTAVVEGAPNVRPGVPPALTDRDRSTARRAPHAARRRLSGERRSALPTRRSRTERAWRGVLEEGDQRRAAASRAGTPHGPWLGPSFRGPGRRYRERSWHGRSGAAPSGSGRAAFSAPAAVASEGRQTTRSRRGELPTTALGVWPRAGGPRVRGRGLGHRDPAVRCARNGASRMPSAAAR